MSPKDSYSSLDFDELRRRHEEYKQRQARAAAAVKKAAPRTLDEPVDNAYDEPEAPVETDVRISAFDDAAPVEAPTAYVDAEEPDYAADPDMAPIEPSTKSDDKAGLDSEDDDGTEAYPEAEEDTELNRETVDGAEADEPETGDDALPEEDYSYDDDFEDEPDEEMADDEDADETASDDSPFKPLHNALSNVTGLFRRRGAVAEPDTSDISDDGDDDHFGDETDPDPDEDAYDEEEDDDVVVGKRGGFFSFLKRRKARDEGIDDSDYADADYAEESFSEAEPHPELPQSEEVPANAPADAMDIEDIGLDAPSELSQSSSDDTDSDFGEDFEEEAETEPVKKKGFRRFLDLFFVHDEDDDTAEDDDAEDSEDLDDDLVGDDWTDTEDEDGIRPSDEPVSEWGPEETDTGISHETYDEDEFTYRPRARTRVGGGNDMDENTQSSFDVNEQLAETGNAVGMSRRERRELAARLAAEEEARRAEEEAFAAEQPGYATEDFNAPEPEAVDEPKEPATPSFEASRVSESTAADETDEPDEPTRIFKRISDTEAAEAKAREEEDDEGDDEKDTKKASRFSFFRRKSSEANEEEDEDDEDEDEDEETSSNIARSHGGKVSSYDEDEDEDDDDYDDDDDDEDDDYDDEYDDDEEVDYDDDDEDDRPFGHHLIGFFKGLLGIILVLLLIVVVFNFLDYFNVVSLDNFWNAHYDKAPGVFDTLLPSHAFKKEVVKPENFAPVEAPTAAPQTQAPTEQPVVTEAPAVIETPVEAPVEEAATSEPAAAPAEQAVTVG